MQKSLTKNRLEIYCVRYRRWTTTPDDEYRAYQLHILYGFQDFIMRWYKDYQTAITFFRESMPPNCLEKLITENADSALDQILGILLSTALDEWYFSNDQFLEKKGDYFKPRTPKITPKNGENPQKTLLDTIITDHSLPYCQTLISAYSKGRELQVKISPLDFAKFVFFAIPQICKPYIIPEIKHFLGLQNYGHILSDFISQLVWNSEWRIGKYSKSYMNNNGYIFIQNESPNLSYLDLWEPSITQVYKFNDGSVLEIMRKCKLPNTTINHSNFQKNVQQPFLWSLTLPIK